MAAKIIIPAKPFRQSGFPIVHKSGGDIVKVEDSWISSKAKLSTLPDGNATWPDDPSVPLLSRDDVAIIEDQLYQVKLSYEAPGYGGEANQKEKKVFSLRYNIVQVPIENHSDYKYAWNHGVAASSHGIFSTIAAGEAPAWEAAGRTAPPNSRIVAYKIPVGYEKKLLIYKDPADIPAGWVTDDDLTGYYGSRSKKGIDFFEVCLYEVHEFTPFGISTTQKNKMKAYVKCPTFGSVKYNNPHLEVPEDTFGLPTTTGTWLCYGPEIDFTGKKYNARRVFKHAPEGWDTDIYKALS
jgi:hypothetical protein